MEFVERLLCCCCLPREESRRERKEHARLHKMSGSLQTDHKPGSAKPSTAQDILVTSDLEMPTAQIEKVTSSDLEKPTTQIEKDTSSDLELPTAQIEKDTSSDLELPTAQIEKDTSSDLEKPTTQIEKDTSSDLEMPTAQIEKDTSSDLEKPTAQKEKDTSSDLEMPTAQKEKDTSSDLEMPTAQKEKDTSSDLEMPTAQKEKDTNSDLVMLTENVEQSGSEQQEQAAENESPMKIEITAPDCEIREENGPRISEESFEFHRVLGRGGFGKVLLAELKESGQYYAVKTLAKANFLETEELDSLRTERRVLMLATGSPFLSRLHCIFQTEDYVFLVMEYISGGNLRFHLDQWGYFDLDCVRFYAAEIICGLQCLHSNGVIYRDLKAENIMLDQDGHIKIVDFGISKENMSGDRRTKTFCGSPHYMAPEIYQEQEYSSAVDWWAFGVLLFQMLTGETPFLGEELDDLSKSVCSDALEYPSWMDQCTRDLLGKLLQRDPDRRLGTSGNIRAHPFFKPIDWAKIETREVEPPYKPELKSPHDCSYFEEEFLHETPWLSQGGGGSFFDQSEFDGFSFVNPKFEHE